MQLLWDLSTVGRGSRIRRWLWALLIRDLTVLLWPTRRRRSVRTAVLAGLAGDSVATVAISRIGREDPRPSPIASRFGTGVGWQVAMAWPRLPALVAASTPTAFGAVEQIAGGLRWRTSWREPARDALDSAMLMWSVDLARNTFLRRSDAMAEEVLAAIRAATARAKDDGVASANHRQFLEWHRSVLTSFADVRLRAEASAVGDPRYTEIAEAVAATDSRLRTRLYDLAFGEAGIAITGPIGEFARNRRQRGRVTLVRIEEAVAVALVSVDDATRLRMALGALEAASAPLEVAVEPYRGNVRVMVTTPAPMLPDCPPFEALNSGDEGTTVSAIWATS